MDATQHYLILTDNKAAIKPLIQKLMNGQLPNGFQPLQNKLGLLFSRSEIHRYMDEEERHDIKIITSNTAQPLKTMSSGEQKKALLQHLLTQQPDYIILLNPYDNLDVATQTSLKAQLVAISKHTILVQVVSRLDDILELDASYFKLEVDQLVGYTDSASFFTSNKEQKVVFNKKLPEPLLKIEATAEKLIEFNEVSVAFNGKPVLDRIQWTIKKNEFWQLIGPNGSGKTTLLSMITGDSHKGYGTDLKLFGNKKGSGESVWELKSKIGYFTPAMTDKFRGYHSVEHMLVSGFHDSVGLYVRPTDQEKRKAKEWLQLLDLESKKNQQFKDLSQGQKRLVMTARAMVKHPPLLILDEPTAGLDDANASLFIALVNKIANESDTTIVFVSHRKEIGLEPQFNYYLEPAVTGSTGHIAKS
ncbi:ATP-binding cassette domain-containing protein [Muricauda sp. 2012CJ35-5]|uniref:ATP-binding cassette domain-containing protein n=1 Tax=Flagellimonas spongiicola TaxID=2942208 RepID=A0ABT0PMW2_9FLAO|nr:ATP-binding cassette domain-containing protein [Allomuricauda spongiicola]MCL6272581.1 ATP-binding cassette domain-containing protein [Allomuricauda spongiicola]